MSVLKLLVLLCLLAHICSAGRPTRRRIEVAQAKEGKDPHVDFPACGDNQVLTNRAGVLKCVDVVPPPPAYPTCGATQGLTVIDGVLTCVDTVQPSDISIIDNSIQDLESRTSNLAQLLSSLQTQVNNINPGISVYFGQTHNTKGNIVDQGLHGIEAATSLCKKVAGAKDSAHMCTVEELYLSVASGSLKTSQTLQKNWVYATGSDGAEGLNQNCGGYTYDLPDKVPYGTAVEWKVSVTRQYALHFYSTPNIPCGMSLPIACCH